MADQEDVEMETPPSEAVSTPMTPTPTATPASESEAEMRDEDGGVHVDGIYIPPPPPPALTFECDGPRLIISHIENENFKSYAGVKILGPFHKSFTSIVGPNGSGKSNVIDSMLFVFGYRAQKIRSKKISVLIHDSENHPDIRSCKVRVHFQEIIDDENDMENGYRVVENSSFVVGRAAFKDNSSYYEINGKKCLFKDVARLLRKKGVDLDHNRFLILQGEVEQIALMKPIGQSEHDTGMLEFLEDIIGSSRFKEPIDELKRRVGELDEHRAEKLNRVKLVEKEKDELEKPKNEAMEFLHAENEIVHKKNIGYQQYVLGYTSKLEETKTKQAQFETESKELLEKLGAISQKKLQQEVKYKEFNQEMEKIAKEVESAEENFKRHEFADTQLREEMKGVNGKRKKIVQLSKMEKDKYEKFLQVPESNKGKIQECVILRDRLLGQCEEEQKKYDQALESLKSETQEFQDKKEKFETQLINLRADENDKESKYNVAKSEMDLLSSTEQKEQCILEQLQQRFDNASQGLAEKRDQIKKHEAAIPKLTQSVDKMQVEIGQKTDDYEHVSVNLRKMRSHFEETKSHQAASKSRGKVHDALLKQKQSGGIKGIYGRLGDLGGIDKKYDVAISTAAGNSLDNLIVDNVETAKKCIDYLKRNDIGRINVLAHDKSLRWRSHVCNANFSAPENVPRLIDLVKVDNEEMKTAFYQYLRDTLVADNLEQAKRIAFGKQRFRVVTIEGEVIETSGAMAGGGREKMHGKMGTTQVKQVEEVDLKSMEKNLNQEESKLHELQRQKQQLELELVKAKKELLSREKELKKLSLEVGNFNNDEQRLKSQIDEQKKIVQESKPDKDKLKEMDKCVQALYKDYEEASENSREIKEAVKELNKKIKEIHGNKVKSVQGKLDSAKAQLDKVKKEITRLEVGIKSAERDVNKSKDKYESYDAEVAEAENKMREMKAEREKLEQEGKDVMQKVDELKQAEEEAVQRLHGGKEELAALEQEENKYKSDRIEIDQVNEKFTLALKEHTRFIHHWKREIARLKLEDIPGEDKGELKQYEHEELEKLDMKQWQVELNVLEESLSAKRPDLNAIEEFRRKESVYLERVAELDEITKRRDRGRKRHDDLRKMRLNEFMEGFGIITGKLKEMYQMITLGGDAELELVDSLDPFTEGIVFSVRPPKKSWKNISNLSGGEKTLSSLALVFALHYYKPTPLYVMDEIDAALDFKNVSIVANYIKERTKNAQFIIISLRSNMFELADRLVGIYKTDNCTKSVTINPGIIAKEATVVNSK